MARFPKCFNHWLTGSVVSVLTQSMHILKFWQYQQLAAISKINRSRVWSGNNVIFSYGFETSWVVRFDILQYSGLLRYVCCEYFLTPLWKQKQCLKTLCFVFKIADSKSGESQKWAHTRTHMHARTTTKISNKFGCLCIIFSYTNDIRHLTTLKTIQNII